MITGDDLKQSASHDETASARLLMILGLAALASLAYWPSTAVLYDSWTDFENLGGTHGFLVAGIVLWLLWRKRFRIAAATVRPSAVGFGTLLACSFAWLVSWKAGIQDLHVALFPALIWLAVLAALGPDVARAVSFPLGYFYLAIPAWSVLEGPLQGLTTAMVGVFLWIAGLPAYVEDNVVWIPDGAFEIAGSCSGLHVFMVGLAIAALQGEVWRASLRARVILVALMAGLALLSNWVRIFTIVVAGYLTDMQHYLVTVDHYWFGWGVFGAACVVFFLVAGRLPMSTREYRPAGTTERRASAWGAYGFTVLILLAGPAVVYALQDAHTDQDRGILFQFSGGKGQWSGPFPAERTEWQPTFEGASGSRQVTYRSDHGRVVEVFAVVYRKQRQGAELVGSGSSLLGHPERLSLENERIVRIASAQFREAVAIDRHGRRSVIWWTYDVGGRHFVRPLLFQLWYGVRSLVGEVPSLLVAFRTDCVQTCDAARAALKQFLSQMEPGLRADIARALGSARD